MSFIACFLPLYYYSTLLAILEQFLGFFQFIFQLSSIQFILPKKDISLV